jgi:class 3 adenylate cyclase
VFQVDFAPQTKSQPRSVRLYPPLAASTQVDNVRSVSLESSSELVIRVSTNSDDEQPGPGCHERLTMGKWEQRLGKNIELVFIAVPNSRVTLSLSPDLKGPLHSSREELDSLMIEPLNPRRLSIGPYGLAQPDQIRERVGQPFLAVKDLGLGGDFFSVEISGLFGVPISEVLGARKWLLFAGVNVPLLLWLSKAFSRSARRPINIDAFVMSAKGETSTKSFQNWAGGDRVTLAIVFTDVVRSTALGEQMRDETMNEVRRRHFVQSRELIGEFKGREIKTIGDSFMVAFKSVDLALDYARSLRANTGDPQVQIRAGIHIGPMQVEESDVFGGTVNFAARVVGAIAGAEIWLSDRAKDEIDQLGRKQHEGLKWIRHEDTPMRGFPGAFTLWSLNTKRELGRV